MGGCESSVEEGPIEVSEAGMFQPDGVIPSWQSCRRGADSAGVKEGDGEHSEGGVNLLSFRNRPHRRKPIVSVATDMVKWWYW